MECDVARHHIDSFNYLLDPGVDLAAKSLTPIKFRWPSGEAVIMKYKGARIENPRVGSTDEPMYPSECRQRGMTYRGRLLVDIEITLNGLLLDNLNDVYIGDVPIMLMSKKCNLQKLNQKQLLANGEEATERGGYFVNKGSEKVIRMLIANRQNYPISIVRESFKDKGMLYSKYGVILRSVLDLHTTSMITMHYLESATMVVAIQYERETFYIPLMYIIKSLTKKSDSELDTIFRRGRQDDMFWKSIVSNMMLQCQEDGILHQEVALKTLGTRFRQSLSLRMGPWEDVLDAGKYLMDRCVAIHLKDWEDKLHLLVYMAQKLYALSTGQSAPESPDNPQFQEAALGGHIMLQILRERMESVLRICKFVLVKKATRSPKYVLSSAEVQRILLPSTKGKNEITQGIEYFIATGNLVTKLGIGLQQYTGYSVVAERINQLRFISHFRAIHRGAFFTEMRTTDVRKLRPESWGYICPVHTPDGAPCGLLNHITAGCRIATHYSDTSKLMSFMQRLGLYTHQMMTFVPPDVEMYPVYAMGNHVGFIPVGKAPVFERLLRLAKVSATDTRVPFDAEIALVRKSPDPKNIITQHPGVYIFTEPARMYRPVRNLITDSTEMIGIFEQVYLSVALDPEDAEPGVTLHQELHPSCLFSYASNLIPFPDHNQSPRNIYQCQMAKQTLGTAIHSWFYRNDNKMYRLQFPQKPLLKTEAHDLYGMDEYPSGTNACLFDRQLGYDMEDAMVINRGSFQRGFAHGTVVKVEEVDLTEKNGQELIFFMENPAGTLHKTIDPDGLPIQGRRYQEGEPYMTTFNLETGQQRVHKFHYAEPAYCGFVRLVTSDEYPNLAVKALIQWRIERNPIIGDKFASRHGQKGINSFLWPVESLPFSESGVVPDIIFNPHGFPSRMTIGMMIESMAGKGAAMHGAGYDASPFVFNENNTAIDHFGTLLKKAGYNYFGEETMYSGIDGREFTVQIFFGIVYYQRLRHMIADKFQVRATGSVDYVTHQPVKGRKKGGGIRFGEMERDAIISHGASFMLQDRLLNCSDRDIAHVCRKCGSLLSVLAGTIAQRTMQKGGKTYKSTTDYTDRPMCRFCDTDKDVYVIQLPHVLRFLVAELAAMNVRLVAGIEHPTKIRR
ncbi:unnamed protein product, partial [Mesorhabditis spiculigera]